MKGGCVRDSGLKSKSAVLSEEIRALEVEASVPGVDGEDGFV